jgi:hypothetical protein
MLRHYGFYVDRADSPCYDYIMNKVAAKDLYEGAVLIGSGFVVTANAWRGVRTPKGKVYVEGYYPGQEETLHVWNASTVVSVL